MENENGLSAAKQIISKPIKGWEDRYSITNDGKVYSYISGRFLHKGFDKDGYALVTLSRDNYRRTYKIHRLVAETFIDNPDNKEEVNHKDFNRKNNWFENLEWVTKKRTMIGVNYTIIKVDTIYKKRILLQTCSTENHLQFSVLRMF